MSPSAAGEATAHGSVAPRGDAAGARVKTPDAIPVGKLSRTAVLGVTAAKIGTRKLRLLSKRPFLSPESFRELQVRQDDEVAELLFDGLSKLRGSALKVAQFLSLELGLLSEAHRKELYKSHSASTRISAVEALGCSATSSRSRK
jgi:predicted unusual protein kinase regulating ubiquinone biosynthesis (AarF/ABC1/UbiB family)